MCEFSNIRKIVLDLIKRLRPKAAPQVRANVTATVRTFAPEQWGEVDFFRHFYAGTHELKREEQRAVLGITNHLRKAILLHQLSQKLLPNLAFDEEELNTKGYTAAIRTKELSAVLEEVFTELYSSIDCARKVIVATHRGTRGLPDSTRKLFQRVRNGEINEGFPEELATAISKAEWYWELLVIRDELTHSDIGSCSIDRSTKLLTYMHTGINREGRPLIIEDVIGRTASLIGSVNQFLGAVFRFLNSQLRPVTIDQLCGIFFGRGYMRKLPLERPVTFDSGTCVSYTWFDTNVEFRCPFATECIAYARARLPSGDASPRHPI